MIKETNQINTDTPEGFMLLMAIAKITSQYETNKTPDEVLNEISILADKVKNND